MAESSYIDYSNLENQVIMHEVSNGGFLSSMNKSKESEKKLVFKIRNKDQDRSKESQLKKFGK